MDLDKEYNRAVFEKYAAQYPGSYNLERYDLGIGTPYKDSSTQSAWAGWKAAHDWYGLKKE